MTVKTQQFLL